MGNSQISEVVGGSTEREQSSARAAASLTMYSPSITQPGCQKCKSCVHMKEKTGVLARRKLEVNYLDERGLE